MRFHVSALAVLLFTEFVYSALAGLESQDGPGSPPSTSPPVTKSQPAERRRSKSPKGKEREGDGKPDETS